MSTWHLEGLHLKYLQSIEKSAKTIKSVSNILIMSHTSFINILVHIFWVIVYF